MASGNFAVALSGKTKVKARPALGRVIVVEDDPVLALAIEDALIHLGNAREVVICHSTAATMTELEKQRPDAIVLDVHLSDRNDGWAVAELVELLGPKRPRIVFSTGSPEEIPPGIAEMGPIFEKPYNPADLVEALSDSGKTGFFARLRGRG